MPYLDPAVILREFSSFAATEIRPALADGEEFMHGQVGSMASTLRFLADELEGFDAAVATQREALLDALETTRATIDDPAVAETVTAVESRVRAADGNARGVEQTVLEGADEALAAVDALDDAAAREARAPLYEFIDERLEAQLTLLGRPADGG